MLSNKDIRVENGKLIINGAAYDIGADTSEIEAEVEALSVTVGDSTNGLVKDVNDLSETVGDNSSGLVKAVNDLSPIFEQLTNDRVNTPQAEESKTMTITRGGKGIFNTDNDDIKYLWFVFIFDDSGTGVELPGPICIPRAFFSDQKTFFTYRTMRCDVEIRRGAGENQIIWNWVFDSGDVPTGAYRYRVYATN